MKFAIINSLIITTLLACKSVQSILVGANSSNSNVQQQTEQNVNNDLTAAQTIQSNISQSNLKLSDGSNNSSKELDSSSTFYYEADAFLLNKPPLPQPVPDYKRDKTSASTLSVSGTTTKNATGEQVAAASFSSISGRNGRMLDLDALVGDLEASRANKQRLQSGARQSRNLQLSQQLQNLDLGSGSGKRRLHIQGFIPIVGVRDDEALSQPDPDRDDNQQPDSSIKPDDYLYSTALKQHQQHQHQQPQRQKSLMSHRQLSMVPMIGGASNELGNSLSQSSLPYGGGQSSIGHASFNVQRYLNPEGQQQQQQDTSSNHIGQSQQVDAKYSAHFGPSSSSSSSSSSSVVETLKKPIKKLTSSLVGAASGSSSDIKDLTAFGSSLNGAQQNCLCVPFYMCKSGFISESSLGRSQMQQLISQQQQQQQQQQLAQQPRQLTLATNGNQQLNGDQLAMQSVTNGAAVRPGTVESVPAAASLSPSYANSFVTVDERSFDREIVTAPPQQSSGASSSTDQLEQATNSSSSPSQLDALNQLIGDNQLDSAKPGGGGGSSGQQGFNELQSNQAGNNNSSQVQQVSGTATLSDEQQAAALNNSLQSNDYSQEILGRMLGLKAPSLPFVSSSSSAAPARSQHSSTGGGACGLLRTCCNIVANQPAQPQPQQQQQQQQQHFLAPSSTQLQQISRMQQQQQQQLYSPINNNLVSNHHYTEPMQLQQQQSSPLVHRTSNQYPAQQRIGAPVSPAGSFNQQLAQFARATSPLQAMQSFQQQQQQQQQQLFLPPPQQQQQQLQSSQMQPQQVTQQVIRATNDLQQYQQQQQPQLGTRKLLDGRCGLRQSSGINGRVQNLQYSENAAEFGEYPAQAAILKRLNGSESLFVCSGTLISQSWVATAAHCIRKHAQGELKVRLGEWDVHRDDEFYGYVEKQVRDLIIHPEFVAGNLINDIALLRLESPIDATLPHINPACLPSSDESFARQRCWVTGWGKDSFGQKGSFQAVLQEVELPVLTNANCEQALRQTRLGPHYRLHPGFICAGGEGGRDACEGDGGSGLYCVQDGGAIKVAGLVSWGIGCGQAGVPGVYVGMAHYRPWIENIISIDEDIYSSYNSLPFGMPNTLISERSNDATNSSTTVAIATTAAEAMQSSV